MISVQASKIQEYKSKGWWGNDRCEDLFQRSLLVKPDEVACVDPINADSIVGIPQRRLTWRQMDELVADYAAILVKQGLRKDDAVVVQLPNIVDLVAIYLACSRLGVIVSPVPIQYRENELNYIVESVEARAIITATRIGQYAHAEMARRIKAENSSVEFVLSFGDKLDGVLHAETARAGIEANDLTCSVQAQLDAKVIADDIFTVCWTSGTEANPKGVPRSHNEWIIMGEGVVDAGEMQPGYHLLNPFPMVNMAGISTSLISWLLVSGVLVLHQPFDVPLFLKQLRDERIQYTVVPPAVMNKLLQNESLLDGIDFSRLKTIGSGSAPLSDWAVDLFHTKYGVKITNFFGSNEGACFTSTYNDVPDPAHRAKLFPRYATGFTWRAKLHDRIQTRLVDPETEEEIVEAGRLGELRLKGPTVFSGYWRQPELSEKSLDSSGWFKTGDLFKIAGENLEFYEFSGRLKEIVVRGGMKISSEEIESLLVGHPEIDDVAVVGVPDEIMGERICAFVVLKSDVSICKDSINKYLVDEKKIAVFKQVERLEFIDVLPRNPVGKVMKRVLREMLV